MCSVARPFRSLCQDTLVVDVHARQHATLSCTSAPSMGQTLAALASVMVAVLRLWGVVSATACFDGSMVMLGMMRFANKAQCCRCTNLIQSASMPD